jgi:hypothetical protein
MRNEFLLYKELTRLMMDYACPNWRYAALDYVRQLQVLQSKYLCIPTSAHWYIKYQAISRGYGSAVL